MKNPGKSKGYTFTITHISVDNCPSHKIDIKVMLRHSTHQVWADMKTNGPRSDKRDLMAIKVKSNIFTQKERPTYWEQLLKI